MTYPPYGEPPRSGHEPPAVTSYLDVYQRTGICPRLVSPHDTAHRPCPICQHTDYLHGGFLNPDPRLAGCLLCHLLVMAERAAAPPPAPAPPPKLEERHRR